MLSRVFYNLCAMSILAVLVGAPVMCAGRIVSGKAGRYAAAGMSLLVAAACVIPLAANGSGGVARITGALRSVSFRQDFFEIREEYRISYAGMLNSQDYGQAESDLMDDMRASLTEARSQAVFFENVIPALWLTGVAVLLLRAAGRGMWRFRSAFCRPGPEEIRLTALADERAGRSPLGWNGTAVVRVNDYRRDITLSGFFVPVIVAGVDRLSMDDEEFTRRACLLMSRRAFPQLQLAGMYRILKAVYWFNPVLGWMLDVSGGYVACARDAFTSSPSGLALRAKAFSARCRRRLVRLGEASRLLPLARILFAVPGKAYLALRRLAAWTVKQRNAAKAWYARFKKDPFGHFRKWFSASVSLLRKIPRLLGRLRRRGEETSGG